MFGFHMTRNRDGKIELWREGRNWVITRLNNSTSTKEHIRVGDWVCSAKRLLPFIFLITYHYPMGCCLLSEDDYEF